MPYTQSATPTFYTAGPTSNYPTPINTSYYQLGSTRFDSSIYSQGLIGSSGLATPIVAPGQAVYSTPTGQVVVNIGSWATPVLKRITTS